MIMFRRYRLFGNQLVAGVGEIGISSSGRIRRNGACHAEPLFVRCDVRPGLATPGQTLRPTRRRIAATRWPNERGSQLPVAVMEVELATYTVKKGQRLVALGTWLSMTDRRKSFERAKALNEKRRPS